MSIPLEHLFETRFWAFWFLFALTAPAIYILVGVSSARNHSKDFWAPLTILAELAAALSVVAAFSFAAQYLIRQNDSEVQKNFSDATHKREGSAFSLQFDICKSQNDSKTNFREASAKAQLCELGHSFSRSPAPALDEALRVIASATSKVQLNELELVRIEDFKNDVRSEIKASQDSTQTKLSASTRPKESNFWVYAIALSSWLAATLKLSKAISEWRSQKKSAEVE